MEAEQSLYAATEAMAHLSVVDALLHLNAAVTALSGMAEDLKAGKRLDAQDQRAAEKALLDFRGQLRHAGVLTERGLAYCKDWADFLVPQASAYGQDGAAAASPLLHEFSLDG